MPLPTWTDAAIIGQLASRFVWGAPVITYSFATAGTQMAGTPGQAGFTPMGAVAREKAALAFSLWDDLIARSIAEAPAGDSSRSTDVELALSTTLNTYAATVRPAASVWFNANYVGGVNGLVTPYAGSNGFVAYVHEIGHALGLNHMGNYNGSITNPSCFQDSMVYSVMSYFGPPTNRGGADIAMADWVAANNVRYYAQTPMMNDIMAMQKMYGADTGTRTDDTVYGFNSNVTGLAKQVFDFKLNAHPVLCVYDSAGNDTLDLSGFATPSTINLAPGSFSDCDGMTMNISIAYTCDIENAVGGAGADRITGNALANSLTGNGGADMLSGEGGADILTGGAGNDILNGGAGNDTARFAARWDALSFTYVESSGDVLMTSALDGIDTVRSVETFVDGAGVAKSLYELVPSFSVTADAALAPEGTGSDGTAAFTVSLSRVSARAVTVDWTIVFGSGEGQADASDFSGPLSGTVEIAAGANSASVLLNLAGDDVAEADEAFTLLLGNPSQGTLIASPSVDGRIANDDLDIRHIGGGGDLMLLLRGSDNNNTISGSAGPETILGLGGNDTLNGKGGDDILNGGAGRDRLTGGGGKDIFAFNNASHVSEAAANGFAGDVITDFQTGSDKIDLKAIDASAARDGNQAFTWLGGERTGTGAGGELRVQQFDNDGTGNDYTMVYGDTDADAAPEFAIRCTGLIAFTAADFVL